MAKAGSKLKRAPKKPRRPRRLEGDVRKEQLIQLGIRLFGEYPYDRLSTTEIARLAGVSYGLLYHYFPSKRDYYVAVVRAVAEEVKVMARPPEHRPLLESLMAATANFVRYARDNAGLFRVLTRGGIGADADINAVADEVRGEIISRLLRRVGVKSVAPHVYVHLHGWLGFAEAACWYWLEHQSMEEQQVVELIAATFPQIVPMNEMLPPPNGSAEPLPPRGTSPEPAAAPALASGAKAKKKTVSGKKTAAPPASDGARRARDAGRGRRRAA